MRQLDPAFWHKKRREFPSDQWNAAISHWFPDRLDFVAQSACDENVLPLDGQSFLAKDLFDLQGEETKASSLFLGKILGKANQTAELISELETLGAHCIGKTHLNEFAYGLSGENVHTGDCPHPLNTSVLSGGSSSGSAWAVGSGLVPFALGTDTGGSIRVPAAFCGLHGFRGVPGWKSTGCFPLAPRFDTVGWFTRTSEESDEILSSLLPPKRTAEKKQPTYILWEPWLQGSEVFRHYEQDAARLGVNIDLDLSKAFAEKIHKLPSAFSILQSQEALTVHRTWLDSFKDQYDPATWQRIARARDWTSQQVEDAEELAVEWKAWITEVLTSVGTLCMPAVPVWALPKSRLDSSFREQLLQLTVPASLAGLPARSWPIMIGGWKSLGWQEIALNSEDLLSH